MKWWKMMKNFFAIFFFILIILTSFSFPNNIFAVTQTEGRTVKIGVYENSPKVYRDASGVISGLYPDILNFIAKQENWRIQYVYGTWEEGLSRLKNGEIHIMVDVATSEDRQKEYDFTNETVLNSWGVVSVRKNSSINSFPDLEGKKIAILKSSVYLGGPEAIDQYLHAFGVQAEFIYVDEYAAVYERLNKGDVDAAVVSRIFAVTNAKKYPNIKSTDIFFSPTELRFAFTKSHSENPYLIEKLDYWVKKIKSEQGSVYYQSLKNHGLEGMIIVETMIPVWVYPAIPGLIFLVVLLGYIIFRLLQARLRAIQVLRQSEEKFSGAFQTSPYAITITRIEDGKFLDVNNAFLSLTGFTKKEALENSSIGLQVWSNIEDRNEMVADLQARRPVINREYLFKTKNGEQLMGLFSAHMMFINSKPCILSSIANINDLKQAERKILEFKERDEAILESIGDAVIAVDTDGKIVLFNHVAVKLTGVSREKAIDKPYSVSVSFVKESDGKPSNDFIHEAISQDKPTKMVNHTLVVRKDNYTTPVATSAAPVKNAAGEIIGCVVVFRDVTQEREIDKAKTEFVSLASHQLRTPITTLRWLSELLASGANGSLNKKQQEYADEIHNASKRMIALVNAILNASRLELGTFVVEPQLVEIKKIAKSYIHELMPQIKKKKIIFKEKYGADIPAIVTDQKLIGIILNNLLTNAIKYTPIGGKIDFTILKKGTDIVLTVADTGVGIPEAQQKKIFTKMFRADNAKTIDPDGTGLGLYIVKEIINRTGGKISFTSEENKGSTFRFVLPLSGMVKKEGSNELL